jgi:hypothetical protein
MAERGMAAEARTLLRCCFENAFFPRHSEEGGGQLPDRDADGRPVQQQSDGEVDRPGTEPTGTCTAQIEAAVGEPDQRNQTNDTGLRNGRLQSASVSGWSC